MEPTDVWFHGYDGIEAGWDTYNHTVNNCSYYTHDYIVYWQYLIATMQWNYYNGTAWVPTSGLGIVACSGVNAAEPTVRELVLRLRSHQIQFRMPHRMRSSPI